MLLWIDEGMRCTVESTVGSKVDKFISWKHAPYALYCYNTNNRLKYYFSLYCDTVFGYQTMPILKNETSFIKGQFTELV